MIGRKGEKRFGSLCTDYGATCNKSEEDDYGWDFYVEFPAPAQPAAALDMRAGPTRALVQVKATEKEGRSVSLSLDNALRYSQAELPVFIVLAVPDGPRTSWYAKHVWIDPIGAWLRAARVADANGIVATNRESVSLTFSEDDRHDEDLLCWIEREIMSRSPDYPGKKARIVRTIGFGPVTGKARVTFESVRPLDLIDLQLGLTPSLPVSRVTYRSERFGVLAGKPEIDETNVRFSMMPHGRDGTLRVAFPNGKICSVPARLHAAMVGEHQAWRTQAACLDIVVGPGERSTMQANLKRDKLVSLAELSLFAHLQQAPPNVPIENELCVDDEVFALGTMTLDGGDRLDWPWFAICVDALAAIGSFSEQRVPELSMDSLLPVVGELETLGALVGDVALHVDSIPNPDAPLRFDSYLGYCAVTVGGCTFGAVVRRGVKSDEKTGERRHIIFSQATILWASVDRDSERHRERMIAAYNKHLERMLCEGEIFALGDLLKIASAGSGDRPLIIDRP